MIKILSAVYGIISVSLYITILFGMSPNLDNPVLLFFQVLGLLNIFFAAHFLDLVYSKEPNK